MFSKQNLWDLKSSFCSSIFSKFSIISISEALLDSGVDSLKETTRSLSSSLSWLRDSPKHVFFFYNKVPQLFSVLVDGTWKVKFTKETLRDKLLYIKPFLPPISSFTSLGWKCKVHAKSIPLWPLSLKCGPTSRHIFTSHSCWRFWSFGKPKNPTRFPSGSEQFPSTYNRAHNNRYLTYNSLSSLISKLIPKMIWTTRLAKKSF